MSAICDKLISKYCVKLSKVNNLIRKDLRSIRKLSDTSDNVNVLIFFNKIDIESVFLS